MRYRALTLRCECGWPTRRLREVGFTADHQLVVHWNCNGCGRSVYAFKTLVDCWEDCPTEEDLAAAPASDSDEAEAEQEVESDDSCQPVVEEVEEDRKFLQSLGVILPEEPAP